MKFAELTSWVEEHPTESIVIGGGGLILLLWLLGFFSSSSSSGDSGSSSLASAYYAAEANQAVVGGEIQVANIQATAATAQNAAQVNGAVAINKAQTKAATTINGQNASSATTINQSNNDAALGEAGFATQLGTTQSNNQLLATYSNNSTALATTVSNNNTAETIDAANNTTSQLNNFVNSVFAPYLMKAGSADMTIPGLGQIAGASSTWTINSALAAGFSPKQAANITGQPYPP
jgi:hypothetical protein